MTATEIISPSWHNWIVSNLQRGCTQESMIDSMVAAGFDMAFASSCIARTAIETTQTAFSLNPAQQEPFRYEPSRIAPGNTIALSDRTVKVALRLSRPEIVIFDSFMTDNECDELVALAKHKLLPSAIVDPLTGASKQIDARSSESTFFQRGENGFSQRLERRIAELINWPVERGEGLQVLHYKVGDEYRPHFDYFALQNPGSVQHMAKGGQRVATFLMYLNDVAEGGGTSFPDAGLSVVPKKGSAVYFAYGNSLGQVDPATLHAGEPVLSGEKWMATKWLREQKYGG